MMSESCFGSTSSSKQGILWDQTWLLRTLSVWVMRTLRSEDDTSSVGNLLPCWTALMGKMLSLLLSQNYLFQLVICSCQTTTVKVLARSLKLALQRYIKADIRPPLRFPRQKREGNVIFIICWFVAQSMIKITQLYKIHGKKNCP